MPITRVNRFTAKAGSEEALYELLQSIVPIIEAADGSISVQVLRGVDSPADILVVEEWEAVSAHQASAKAIPADLFRNAMDLMIGPPDGDYYQ